MRLVMVLAVVLLGCGSGEMEPGMGDADSDGRPVPSDGQAPPDTADTGVAQDSAAPDRTADRTADRSPDTQSPDAGPPPAPACASGSPWSVAPCIRPGGYNMCGGYTSIPAWKDGRECAVCRAGGELRTGCTVLGNPDECTGQDRPPLICVADCSECQER
jgi:hypothetical protein